MPDSIISQFERTFNSPIEVNRSVATASERDAIPSGVRWEGMTVFVRSESQQYSLKGGVDNGNWIKSGFTGITGSFTTSDSKTVTVTNGLITNIV